MPAFCTMPSQAYRAESVLVFGGPAIAAPPINAEPMRMIAIAGRTGTERMARIASAKITQRAMVQAMSAVGRVRSK